MFQKLFIFTFFLLLSGCGTFLTGTSQTIAINSNVIDAAVYVDGEFKCNTPCAVSFDKKYADYAITLKAVGYDDRTVFFQSSINFMLTSNVSNLSIGAITDLTTGGFWAYNQDCMYIILKKSGLPVSEAKQKEKEAEIQRFAFANFVFIQEELLIGHKAGEYSTALSRKTGLSVDQIWQLLDYKQTPLSFSEKVAQEYHLKKVPK